ncbi:hypothetical protein E1A91_D09G137500v1 [Gossypium mustelinum]|uniref:Uncharacterized protein n=1 Tax=Gossypium mustelinum TaxID=34275 RepID=A0A5D2TLJ3_GOSMU|nr:hypothetical protein E1A91_D09G137500v1 [Gossypium mustelinum]TYI65153.1 hypothetical protein E1A91_D09G137500v1 [Gossypium mustelinum]TYI65154.1 hypothetical protein E1A91_D09G137500v1 [Gossypium mustelinum]TYI65155.1 hypothetical protein E1A91_D09G137500v1 [Gossypium mustelinum]
MTCPETLLATTPETDFGQDSSKVASKLSLKTEPAGGHQPMDSCLVQLLGTYFYFARVILCFCLSKPSTKSSKTLDIVCWNYS